MYKLNLPDDFDNYSWELEFKGWFAGASVTIDGCVYKLMFYDMSRLTQDVTAELAVSPAFFESNLIIISTINRKNMEDAVDYLIRSGSYSELRGSACSE